MAELHFRVLFPATLRTLNESRPTLRVTVEGLQQVFGPRRHDLCFRMYDCADGVGLISSDGKVSPDIQDIPGSVNKLVPGVANILGQDKTDKHAQTIATNVTHILNRHFRLAKGQKVSVYLIDTYIQKSLQTCAEISQVAYLLSLSGFTILNPVTDGSYYTDFPRRIDSDYAVVLGSQGYDVNREGDVFLHEVDTLLKQPGSCRLFLPMMALKYSTPQTMIEAWTTLLGNLYMNPVHVREIMSPFTEAIQDALDTSYSAEEQQTLRGFLDHKPVEKPTVFGFEPKSPIQYLDRLPDQLLTLKQAFPYYYAVRLNEKILLHLRKLRELLSPFRGWFDEKLTLNLIIHMREDIKMPTPRHFNLRVNLECLKDPTFFVLRMCWCYQERLTHKSPITKEQIRKTQEILQELYDTEQDLIPLLPRRPPEPVDRPRKEIINNKIETERLEAEL